MAKGATKTSRERLTTVVLRRRSGLVEDVFLLIAALLICAFYQIENYRLNTANLKSMPDLSGLPALFGLPAGWLLTYGMQLFRAGFAVLFIVTLVWLSFSNGILKRWWFLVAVVLLLLLPQLGLALLGGIRQGDGILRFLYELCIMLGQWPFITLQKLSAYVFALSIPAMAMLLSAVSGLLFFGGYLLSQNNKARGF